ncbi:hypothetical protein PCE30_004404 [Citrobacter freundii]|nr:hypothetical protein [Citrobacter freundii]
MCYPWIVQLSGALVVWRSVPRNRPRAAANAQYGAHCAPPWGTCGSCVAAGWVMALQGGAGPGDTVSVAVSGDLRPVPV